MDKYELFKKNTGIDIRREEYEAGISFMSGKMEGHPALIAALRERAWEVFGPVIKEIAAKKGQIPKMLAELSYSDKQTTILLLRQLLNHEKPITPLYDALIKELAKYDHKHENFLKKCARPPQPFEFQSVNPEERFNEMWEYVKSTRHFHEQFEQNLFSLTYSKPKEAIRILRLWGEGKKSAPQLWGRSRKSIGGRDMKFTAIGPFGEITYDNGKLSGSPDAVSRVESLAHSLEGTAVGPVPAVTFTKHLESPLSAKIIMEQAFNGQVRFSGNVPRVPRTPKGAVN